MDFLVRVLDYTDEDAINRRMDVREKHFNRIKEQKKAGVFLFGGAILNEEGKMIGSELCLDLPDEESVWAWIAEDPYTIGKVWEKPEVYPFKMARL